MPLPNFIVFGATKCGTTSLHNWLSRHPEIYVSPWKEMRFFIPGYRWDNGIEWYKRQFTDAAERRAVGEVSNGYGRGFEHPGVPNRIASYIPDVRLIYLIRHPMKRLISHYRHRLVTGREHRPLPEAVCADPAYIRIGCYGAELENWLDAFEHEQIMVVRSEHLFNDTQHELSRISRHLGINIRPEIPFSAKNVTGERHVMPYAIRRLVGALGLWRTGKTISQLFQKVAISETADNVDTDLPPNLADEIEAIYREDRKMLLRYVEREQCDWDLD